MLFAGKGALGRNGRGESRAYGTVRQWGGDISVAGSLDGGSVFRVFSLAEAPGEAGESRKSALRTAASQNPQLRWRRFWWWKTKPVSARWSARFCGGKAMTCWRRPTARTRWPCASRHAGGIDLLITDVLMPHMGGRELVDRLRAQGRDMKVLYVSGYTEDATIYSGELATGTAFLQKPFTLGSLLDKVKEVLAH